jgi:hypothetical protein
VITKERETILCTLYEVAKEKPGWLSKLVTNCKISEEEEAFLIWLDEQMAAMDKRVRLAPWTLDERYAPLGETEDDKIAALCKSITVIEEYHQELRRIDKSYLDRQLMLMVLGYDEKLRLLHKFRARMIHKVYPEFMGVTENEICKAREVPLERVWEGEIKRHRVLCPFHDDHDPSMSIARGFGYCFVCGAWCDATKYLTHIKNVPFVDAVKRLASL